MSFKVVMTRRRLPPAEQMSPYFHEWLQWMETDRALAPATIKAYNSGVWRLVSCAEISPSTFGPSSFDHFLLADTTREMYNEVSGQTWRVSIYALKMFHDFCLARGLAPPYLGFERILRAVPSRHSDPWNPDEIYSPSEIAELYRAAGQYGSQARDRFKSDRDFAIVAFLAVVGLRTGELVAADVSWIQGSWGSEAGVVLEVRTRQGRRTIPLEAEVVSAYEQWMDAREDLFDPPSSDDPLFISESGERLTAGQLNSLIRSLSREAGLRYEPPRALRNAARQALLNDRVPIDEVRRIMGHRKPPHRR